MVIRLVIRWMGGKTAAALLLTCVLAAPAAGAGAVVDCLSEDFNRRIEACTELLERPDLTASDKSLAYSMRALAYSIQQKFDLALADYDMAILLDPASSVALNNRAWALWKTGDPAKGLPDVERSLAIDPASSNAFDTRAHILQSLGHHERAISDYERAMLFGGEKIVRLYQCGLQAAGLFKGEADGLYTSKLGDSLRLCVKRPNCDPLPPDEECRYSTS